MLVRIKVSARHWSNRINAGDGHRITRARGLQSDSNCYELACLSPNAPSQSMP